MGIPEILSRPCRERIPHLELRAGNGAPLDVAGTLVKCYFTSLPVSASQGGCSVASVVTDSLRPHGLQGSLPLRDRTRLLPLLHRQASSLPLRHLGSLNPSQAMSFISVVLASQHRDWHRDSNKLKMSFAFSLRWLRFVLNLDHSGAYFVTWPLLCILLLLLLLILCILLHKLTHLSMLPGTAGWGD